MSSKKMLFDKHGRRIPEGLQANVCDPDSSFRLDQPRLIRGVDYANRIMRLHDMLGDTGVTAEHFKQEAGRLSALIQDNFQIANIAKGVCLPVVLPKLQEDDIGTVLEQYLKAVGKSYTDVFPNRKFYNYREGELAGQQVSIVDGSRHDQLIERMKQSPVIGIHFPNPLQGYSINASREQIATVPEGFVLSGMDTPIAMAMYPDVLACDWNTPRLDMAAFSWRSAGYSLYFKAGDGGLVFDSTVDLADAYDGGSGGLLFLG